MANESISVLKDYSPPRKGKSRIYRLLGVRIDPDTGTFVCPNTRRLPNKFLINDRKNQRDNVKSFVYVSHQDPSISSNSIPASQRGKIVFLKAAMGEIRISGNNPEEFELDKALFFHQQNISNIDKSWHIKPRTREYLFELVDKGAIADVNIKEIERRNDSENVIKNMKIAILRDTYEMLFKQDSEGIDQKEVRSALYNYVQNDEQAKNFLILSQSEQMKAKVVIRNAIDKKIISESIELTSWMWVKGKETICAKLPRKSNLDSLLIYLVTDEGKDVLKTLKDLTEAKN